jgi:hypothetical protein
MHKNPFSLYDFLGYVFPGIIAILLMLCVFYDIDTDDITQLMSSKDKSVLVLNLENTIILTIASYVVGHFVAYLSSITVEKLAIWSYGYPSYFLLYEDCPGFYHKVTSTKNGVFEKERVSKNQYVIRTVVWLLLLPLSVGTVLLRWCKLDNFIVKKLDDVLVTAIRNNQNYLLTFLKIKCDKPNADLHRIVYHYVYEHQDHHAVKLDNYVAIYGFLRALSFIANFACIYVIVKWCLTIYMYHNIDWHYLFVIVAMLFIANVFYMGFLKFYRRFTLESYMSLVTDVTFKQAEPVDIVFSYSTLSPNDTNKYALYAGPNSSVSK